MCVCNELSVSVSLSVYAFVCVCVCIFGVSAHITDCWLSI